MNTNKQTPLKGVRRATQKERGKHAPRGGTRAAQTEHTRVRRGYAGLPRGLKRSYDRTATK